MKKQVKTNYKVGGILLLIAMLAIIFPTVSRANLQSRPGVSSLTYKTASEFFKLCREMETSTGPLGLSATIGIQSSNVVETSASNGIDVHMIKNTEYGTAAMLSASAYGDCPVGYSSSINDSTTQNDSGIKQMASGKEEYVAAKTGTILGDYSRYLNNADMKYQNRYGGSVSSSYIPGDATYETKGWKGAGKCDFDNYSDPVLMRSYYGMFAYEFFTGQETSASTRAAVVCGANF